MTMSPKPTADPRRPEARRAAMLCASDADDRAVLDAVIAHYQAARQSSVEASSFLERHGINEETADALRIGLSDRSLGFRLPERNRKAGAELRERLISLGVYRASGHEHFRGCLVVPVIADDHLVVGLYGIRLQPSTGRTWAPNLPGGIFNESALTSDRLIVVASIEDAAAVISAGMTNVVSPGRPGGFKRDEIRRISKHVDQVVLLGNGLEDLRERLRSEGASVSVVCLGAPTGSFLAKSSEPGAALVALLEHAEVPKEQVHKIQGKQTEPATPRERGPVCAVSGDASELHLSFSQRRWRVRGSDRLRGPDTLRVALAVTDERSGRFHLDSLDLYQSKGRSAFIAGASAELHCDGELLRGELGEVLFATEKAIEAADVAPSYSMSEGERAEAMELLGREDLLDQVLAAFATLGVVGESTNLTIAYLATISRKAERPVGVVVQASSASGKSTLVDAVCQLVPEEDLKSFSALTGQALYYLGASDLAHKVLCVSEEHGASQASYALKLLVSEGKISIASTGKDPNTGRLRTKGYEVCGPVALLFTTTAMVIDPELSNRLVVLGIDENAEQTRAIQLAQRQAATLAGLVSRHKRERLVKLHHNAQRLIEALPVVIPDALSVSFPHSATRYRRDHQKLLSLICASALLHQHQREQKTVQVGGRALRFVEASSTDVELGIRLAKEVLDNTADMAPQERRLLEQAAELWGCDGGVFTRRQLREALGWSEHQVRDTMCRLVALEYVVLVRGAQGSSHAYRLADHPQRREPRGTSRGGRRQASRGEKASYAGRTDNLAPQAVARREKTDSAVSVGEETGGSSR